jgi:beta-mannanase
LGASFSLIQLYTAWGDRPDQAFPMRVATAIADLGSIPVITWEPWLTDFENGLHPHLKLRDDRVEHGFRDVAAGAYDFYVDEWARQAKRFGKPILLRFAHEMNDPYRYPWGPQNNTADEFVAAWRHTVERFRAAGADNVLWVWSPHVAYEGFEWFYPGDDVVDWIGTGALNYGTAANWARWWSFAETFGTHYERLSEWRKPIMIAEFGSLAVGGDREAWYREALSEIPTDYPAVKAVLFFHVKNDATITYQTLDWSFAGDSALVATVKESLAAWPVPSVVP